MSYSIRPVEIEKDAEGLSKLASWIFRAPMSAAELIRRYQRFPAEKPVLRLLAESEGQIAGYLRTNYWGEDATLYQATLGVTPGFRRQGIGSDLVRRAEEFIVANGGKSLLVSCYEDEPEGLLFAEKHGYGPDVKLTFLEFDLTQDLEAADIPEGIRIVSFEELDPATRDDQVFDCFKEADQDVPGIESVGTFDRASYDSMVLKNSNLVCGASFAAFDGDQMVGIINLMLRNGTDPTVYETDFTGVRRAYRGRGIAKALKRKALAGAKARGGLICLTANASTNAAMLATNLRVGFKVKFVEHQVIKRLGGEA